MTENSSDLERSQNRNVQLLLPGCLTAMYDAEFVGLIQICMKNAHETITRAIGVHELSLVESSGLTTVDLDLEQKQKVFTANMEQLYSSLKEMQRDLKELVEPTNFLLTKGNVIRSSVKYVFLGGVLGAFGAAFYACAVFLFSDKLYAVKELKNRFEIKVLGKLMDEREKACFIDAWLSRLEGRDTCMSANAEYELIATNISNMAGNAKTLLVTGSVETEKVTKVCENLARYLKDVKLVACDNMFHSAETLKQLPECDRVVLVEQIGQSFRNVIVQEIEMVRDLDKVIVGCVAID